MAGRPTLVFPGQGAQTVGMGKDVYDLHAAVRRTYDEANAVLGYDIAALSFEGPAETLSRTDITQPALLTNSIALLRELRERGLEFDAALGHSLGEYSALVATGALPFADALRLVARRGAAMLSAAEEASGGMTAVLGIDDAAVEAMRGPWGEADWAAPEQPFFSVCSVAFESSGFADLLARQIVSPVRFAQSIRYLFGKGYDSFLEIGPGSVLSGLIRRIEPGAVTARVADAATLAVAIEGGLQ